jgi:peroxiredoxin Q/BCP
VGVSADTLEEQRAFAAKNNLQFPLVADVDRKVIEAYGVWGERTRPDGTTVTGIRRYTFLIDKDGVIRKTYTNVTPDTHAGEIVADLAELS